MSSQEEHTVKALNQVKVTGILWLVARLWLAYEWFNAGIEKVFGAGSTLWVGPKAGTAVAGFLKGAIAKSALAEGFDPIKTPHPAVNEWYATLARDVFLPNAALFSYLVAVGEVAIGLALILGIFTRFSSVMSVLLGLSLLMAGATSTLPQMLAISVALASVGGAAIGYYGLDFFARPVEIKLLRRAHLIPAPQAA
jgi:thiosulfate dehydrogenase [quinone] large subunit